MRLIKQSISLLVSAALAFTSATPFAVAEQMADFNLPSLGAVAGADLSLRDEREYGEEMMRHVRASPEYMADDETTDYLNRLGYRLIAASQTQPYDFFFFPLRERSLNAFAMPGGFIAVHSGLVIAADTESELASVIGHEIGHVTQRHIARMIEQSKGSMAMTIGSLLLAILAARAGGNSGGNAAMAITMGTQAAMMQKQLAYSRDAEREADRVGFASLVNAGFDPKGMQDFFSKLQRDNRYYESASMAYLSTHPMTTERMGDMQNRSRQLKKKRHADSFDFKLIQKRLVVLQETKYDGWLAANRRFFENIDKATGVELAARYYGISLAYLRLGKPTEALNYAKKAKATVKTTSIILDKHLAEVSFECAKTPTAKNEALNLAKTLAAHYPYSAMATVNYAELLFKAGKNNEIVHFLRKQKALNRDNFTYYALLARSYEALGKKSLSYLATGDMYMVRNNYKAALYQYELAQKTADADFYSMSEIDAKLRTVRERLKDTQP